MSGGIVFDDVIEVKDINADGEIFEKVSRVVCQSENYDMQVTVDINTDIFPISINQRFGFALATSITADETVEDGYWNPNSGPSLADKYDYVMYGIVFKYEEHKDSRNASSNVALLASFGGLLMRIVGDSRNLQGISLDARIYLLMRRVG